VIPPTHGGIITVSRHQTVGAIIRSADYRVGGLIEHKRQLPVLHITATAFAHATPTFAHRV